MLTNQTVLESKLVELDTRVSSLQVSQWKGSSSAHRPFRYFSSDPNWKSPHPDGIRCEWTEQSLVGTLRNACSKSNNYHSTTAATPDDLRHGSSTTKYRVTRIFPQENDLPEVEVHSYSPVESSVIFSKFGAFSRTFYHRFVYITLDLPGHWQITSPLFLLLSKWTVKCSTSTRSIKLSSPWNKRDDRTEEFLLFLLRAPD